MRKNIRAWLVAWSRRGERGVSLVEAMVAVALLGGVVLTLVMSLSGGAMAVNSHAAEATAQGIARTQLEYIKTCPYDAQAATYPVLEAPENYSVTVTVSPVTGANGDIQKVTVAVVRGGQDILSVADYKVNR